MSISDERRKAIIGAVGKYLSKQEPKPKPQSRTNAKPEKDVERQVVKWLKASGFDGQVYESKAKLINNEWVSSGMKFGTCDWQGVTPDGYAAFVEFKAPGKRSTFWNNERQAEYLLSKIEKNAFAVVIDSVGLIETTYNTWLKYRLSNPEGARQYLFSQLPQKPKRKVDDKPLFEE